MEAYSILKMVDYAFYNRFFIVDVIVSDDERTIRAGIKHPSIGVRDQVMKTSKENLMGKPQSHTFLHIPPIA